MNVHLEGPASDLVMLPRRLSANRGKGGTALAGEEKHGGPAVFRKLLESAQGGITDIPCRRSIHDDEPERSRTNQPFCRRQGVRFSSDANNCHRESTIPRSARSGGKKNGVRPGNPRNWFIMSLASAMISAAKLTAPEAFFLRNLREYSHQAVKSP